MKAAFAVCFALGVATTFAPPARADVFSAVDCPRYPSFQQIPATYSTSELTQDFNRTGYGNHIDHELVFAANNLVRHTYLKWSSFELEENYDYLYVHSAGTSPPFAYFTGYSSPSPFYHYSNLYNAQVTPLVTRITTDYSQAGAGFSLEKIGVSCEPNRFIGWWQLQPGKRVSGVLLGPNDSVVFTFPAAGTNLGNRSTNFIAWSDTPLADIDLYVRCNAYPTTSTYTARGYSGDAQEFIHVDPGTCPPGGTWYVVVHSYSYTHGQAQFNLMASHNFDAREIDLGVKVNTTGSEVTAVAAMSVEAVKRVFGYTEGGFWVNHLDVCSSANPSVCNSKPYRVIRDYSCSRSSADYFGHTITLCNDASSTTLAHELGHMPMAMIDEYQDIGTPPISYSQCGHSMMGTTPWWQNNMCYSANHKQDPDNHTTTPTWAYNAWYYMTGSGGLVTPWVPPEIYPNETPDNVNYANHDFNSQVPVTYHF